MNKKRLFLVMTLIIAMTLLFGCSKDEMSESVESEVSNQKVEKLNIITTVFAPYDFVKQIVGENAEVTMLVPPAAESHSYEPTPQDIIKIQNCDVFIYGGGESDEWVTDILASIGNENIKVIKMLECVELVEEEIVEGMQASSHNHGEEAHDHDHEELYGHEETHDHDHEKLYEHEELHDHEEEIEYDEHVWTSPKNAIKIVEAIEKVISSVDTANESIYKANCSSYIKELQELDQAFQQVVDKAKRKEVIFADRFPLRYFVEAYGLKYYAAFPGCSTDTEPSAATVAFLIDKVKEDEIPVVFHIELSNEKMADTICEATGAKKLLFNACHTISKVDFEAGTTYLDIMRQNVETLKEALN